MRSFATNTEAGPKGPDYKMNKTVWILWASDNTGKYIEAIFADKVVAEQSLRHMKDTDNGAGNHYWIQEKDITK